MRDTSPDGPDTELARHIVEAACRQDAAAFEILYGYYQRPLTQYVGRLAGDQYIADDLCQETFVRAWRSAVPEKATYFRKWLYTIAAHVAFDYLRSERKVEFLPMPDDEPVAYGSYGLAEQLREAGPEEQVCAQLLFEAALRAMSPKYRACWLLQNQGYTYQEIADIIGISVSAVGVNINRGYAQLARIYNEMLRKHNDEERRA